GLIGPHRAMAADAEPESIQVVRIGARDPEDLVRRFMLSGSGAQPGRFSFLSEVERLAVPALSPVRLMVGIFRAEFHEKIARLRGIGLVRSAALTNALEPRIAIEEDRLAPLTETPAAPPVRRGREIVLEHEVETERRVGLELRSRFVGGAPTELGANHELGIVGTGLRRVRFAEEILPRLRIAGTIASRVLLLRETGEDVHPPLVAEGAVRRLQRTGVADRLRGAESVEQAVNVTVLGDR